MTNLKLYSIIFATAMREFIMNITDEPLYYEEFEDIAAILRRGEFAKVTVYGSAMKPLFVPGKDYVVLAPVKIDPERSSLHEEIIEKHNAVPRRKRKNSSAAEDRITIRRRDVVLFRYRDTGTLRLLRVVHVWGTLLLLRGDGCYSPYERATVSDVKGVVVRGTCMGGVKFQSTSFGWRLLSKAWTASYRARLWFRKAFGIAPVILLMLVMALGLHSCIEPNKEKDQHGIITACDGQLIKDGKPYYFIGTNLWYGPILASEGEGGDRERLGRELDSLCALGIRNLRVLVGADGPHGVHSKIEPSLQIAPGVYNDTLLRGLDYFLVELGKRDMEAVLYLNNSWEWSGGYYQYLIWSGHGKAALPRVEGYNAFVDYVNAFMKSDSAKGLFENHLRTIVSRTNTITGRPYSEDPAIFSWQIGNEPRCFGKENKELFAQWISRCASVIKEIDHNHLVSIGSEGKYGCEVDIQLWKRLGEDPNIDILNIHIWPYNWNWVETENMSTHTDTAIYYTRKYLDEHLKIAREVGKPLTLEEFGYPRDGREFSPESPVRYRDIYYQAVFDMVLEEALNGGVLAGANFWAWGGSAKASHLWWQKGDDFMGDPAQEEQGLYSIFQSDTSTLRIIKESALRIGER